jgi:DNA-binding NarL/FixJ family response regulator
MLAIYVSMFAFGGVSLLALLWSASADESLAESSPQAGLLTDVAALLTVRGLLAAMTVAGAAGTLLLGVLRLPSILGLLGAAGGAVAGAVSWRRVLRAMRASGNRAAVMILTARGTAEDRVRGLELGADDYLVKPFAFTELLARVRTLARRARMPVIAKRCASSRIS